jgi:hypothetical protein
MEKSIAEIFEKTSNLDEFTDAVIRLEGDFKFKREDMTGLMSAYFERHPDRNSDRNSVEVLLGYKIARVCIIERLINGMDQENKQLFRKIFNDISAIDQAVDKLISSSGFKTSLAIHENISKELNSINDVIDTLPFGMIKERYIGGISNIYNIMYLLKLSLDKYRTGAETST